MYYIPYQCTKSHVTTDAISVESAYPSNKIGQNAFFSFCFHIFKQLWCFWDQYGILATLEVQYQPRIDQKIVLFYDSLINPCKLV